MKMGFTPTSPPPSQPQGVFGDEVCTCFCVYGRRLLTTRLALHPSARLLPLPRPTPGLEPTVAPQPRHHQLLFTVHRGCVSQSQAVAPCASEWCGTRPPGQWRRQLAGVGPHRCPRPGLCQAHLFTMEPTSVSGEHEHEGKVPVSGGAVGTRGHTAKQGPWVLLPEPQHFP